MKNYKIIALTTPVKGKETEYHKWYKEVHIPEVLAFPGVKSAQRYKQVTTLMGEEANPWLTIFDVELNDLQTLLEAMKQAGEQGTTTNTDAVDMEAVQVTLFEEVGEKFTC